MTPESYKQRIADLGLSQRKAVEMFGYHRRTGQIWALRGPPTVVKMLLYAIGKDRSKLDSIRALIDETLADDLDRIEYYKSTISDRRTK